MKYDYLAATFATGVEIYVEKSLFFSLFISCVPYCLEDLEDQKIPTFLNSVFTCVIGEAGNWGEREEVLPNDLLSYSNLLIQMTSKPLVSHSFQEKP